MTIETTSGGEPIVKSGPYNGDGVTTSFDYDFQIQDEDELVVTRQNADGTETTLALTTDYSVSGVGSDIGGAITLTAGSKAPSGSKLVIQYDGLYTQSIDYSNQGRIQLSLLENSLDKLMMHCRSLKEIADRAVTVDAFNTVDVDTLRANITALAAIESAITTVADDIAAIETANANSTNINAVAAIDANITTVAGIAADVTTVADSMADVTAVADDIVNVNTVAAAIDDVKRYAEEYTIAATAPASPSVGDLWYDSTSDVLKFYDGAAWVDYAGEARAWAENPEDQVVDPDNYPGEYSALHHATKAAASASLFPGLSPDAFIQAASDGLSWEARTATQMRAALNVEDGADVTDSSNVAAAGAVMDSELQDEAAVKALDQGVATTDSPTFAGQTINGNMTITGTVDGRDVGDDGTTLDDTRDGAAGTFPSDFQQDGFWFTGTVNGEPFSNAIDARWTFHDDAEEGRIARIADLNTAQTDWLLFQGVKPWIAGHTYRLTVKARTTGTVSGTPDMALFFRLLDETYTLVDSKGFTSFDVTGTFVEYTTEFTASAGEAAFVRAGMYRRADLTGTGDFEVSRIKFEDITATQHNPLTFDTIADVKSAPDIKVGDFVETRGYTTAGDGGGALYKIVAAATGTDDGGSYHDLTGISGQAELQGLGPFNPVMWGAVGDGVTDDTAKVHAMYDWIGTKSGDTAFLSDAKNTFGARLYVTGVPGKVFGLSDIYSPTSSHRNVETTDISFKAVGTWSSGDTIARNFDTVADMVASTSNSVGEFVTTTNYAGTDGRGETYEIVADGTSVNLDDNLFIQLTGVAAQARRVNLFMFDCGGQATYMRWNNIKVNCDDKCGFLKARSRHRVQGHTWIERVRHIGIECAGSDVWISVGVIIGQWTTNDVQYYDKDAYSGVGIRITESDARVIGVTVRWLHTLIDIESTNNIIEHCHMFNGMQGYHQDDRDTALNDDLDTYFGFTPGTAATTDFDRRAAHVGIQYYAASGGVAGKTQSSSFDNGYFDNCHHELYADTLHIGHVKLGSKSSSSLNSATSIGGTTKYGDAPTIDWWFRLHAYETNAALQFDIHKVETYVSSAVRHLVKWVPNGHSWSATTSGISSDTDLNMAARPGNIQIGDGFSVRQPQVIVGDPNQGPTETYYGMGANVRFEYVTPGQAADPMQVRVLDDEWQVRPNRTTAFIVNSTGAEVIGLLTAGDGLFKDVTPNIDLYDTNATAARARTRIGRDGDSFFINTRADDGSALSQEYLITLGASGATQHEWKINNSTKMTLDSNGLKIDSWYIGVDGADLTVASNAITPDSGTHLITAGSPVDLNTINTTNAQQGSTLILQKAAGSSNITIKHGVDNILCGADIVLSDTNDIVMFVLLGASWKLISHSVN